MKKYFLLLIMCVVVFFGACGAKSSYDKYDMEDIKEKYQDKFKAREKWVDKENRGIYEQDVLSLFKDGHKIYIGMKKQEVEKIIGKPLDDGHISIQNADFNIASVDYEYKDETEAYYEADYEDFNKVDNETLIGIGVKSPEFKDCEGIAVGDSVEKVTKILFDKYGEECITVSENKGIYILSCDINGQVREKKNNSGSPAVGSKTYYFYDGKILSSIILNCT